MDHREIIMGLGGPARVAEMLSLPERRVRGWRDRASIPAMYWRSLSDATKNKVKLADLADTYRAA